MIGQLVLGLWAATRRTSTKRVLPAVSAPSENEPKRPDGPLIWLNATTETDRAAGKLLAQHLAEKRPDLAIVVNCDLPPEEQSEVIPDHPNVICAPLGAGPRAFLARWKPDLIVHIGAALDASLVPHIQTPQMMVDARITPPKGASARLWRRAPSAHGRRSRSRTASPRRRSGKVNGFHTTRPAPPAPAAARPHSR